MKRKGMAPMTGESVNVTPLIDIVMCLIIFFMLVTKIGVDTGADTKTIDTKSLPATILGKNIEDMGNTITVNIYMGGGAMPRLRTLDLKTMTPIEPTPDQFKALLTEARTVNNNLRVIVRAPAELPYLSLQPVLIACSEAKVKDVNFQAQKVVERERVN